MTRPVLNQFSIRQRLLLLTMLTSGIGVLLGCAGYLIYDFREIRRQKLEELQSMADFVSTHAAMVLASDDVAGAVKLLDVLHTRPHVRMGVIYGSGGAVFASYVRADLDGKVKIPAAVPVGMAWRQDELTVASAIP